LEEKELRAMEWYRPKSLEELTKLLSEDGALIHSGGTAIKEDRIKSASRVIDMSGLPLGYVKKEGNTWHVGATATLRDVIDVLGKEECFNPLVQALKCTATTPLRNRITVGGSVYLSPLWSNFMGPLLAMDAKLDVAGKLNGTYAYEEFLSNKAKFQGCVVTEVSFQADASTCFFFDRFARTANDYSALTVTLGLSIKDEVVDEAKIVVTGCKKVYDRLHAVEAGLKGKSLKAVDPERIFGDVEIEFADKPAGSGAYLAEVAKVLLARGFGALACVR